MEFYIMQRGIEGTQLSTSKYIDDQYTPGRNASFIIINHIFISTGIFNVWQMKSLSPTYSSSMLWKPVVYQSVDRSIEKNTLMEIYDLKNNIPLSKSDQGIFNALYGPLFVSGFNISFGRAKDGL
jgi:hypothetical protein